MLRLSQHIRQLGKKALAWYRENLVGNSVTNAATGMVIAFDESGANKISGRKGDVLFRSVVALREILADGVLISSEPDNLGRAQIKAVHKFRAAIVMDGETHTLIATVREKVDGTFHYDLSRDKDDIGAKQLRGAGPEANESVSVLASQNVRLALEGSPGLNIDFASDDIKADGAVPVLAMREVTDALNRELAKSGLAGKVYPILVRRLLGISGVEIAGRQQGADFAENGR